MIGPDDVTLAINAGGRGKRLGGIAKGLLEVDGRTVLDRLLDLRPVASQVLLVANDASYARWALPTVADEVPDRGPPGGVVTALGAATTPWVLVVGCDMPFLTREAIAPLLEAADESADVVCAARRGALEPLLGLYRRTLHDAFKAALEQEPSLRSLVATARLRTIEIAAHALDSLNTCDDLARHGVARPHQGRRG